MTRLKKEHIRDIGKELDAYDVGLVRKTGLTLKEIAIRAVGITEKEMNTVVSSNTVAVIPITWGQGLIEGFVDAVQKILIHIGAKVFQSTAVNIAGFAEAIKKGADIVFFADDDRFIALNLHLKRVVDNTEATARGYATALELMAGSLSGQEVLVIGGAGQVGWNAVLFLEKKGAKVSAFDLDQDKMESLVKERGIMMEKNLKEALSRHNVFFDASPATDIIQGAHIRPDTFIAAPGIPLGLSKEAYFLVKERLIHDHLEIGVATMFVDASCSQ